MVASAKCQKVEVELGCYKIGKREKQLLKSPSGWFNDTLIDLYSIHLRDSILKKYRGEKLPNIHVVSSLIGGPYIANTMHHPIYVPHNREQPDLIIMPVTINSHWILFIYEWATKKVHYFNSLLGHFTKDTEKGFYRRVRDFLLEYYHTDKSEKLQSVRYGCQAAKQQSDAVNCGVFLLHHLEVFLGVYVAHYVAVNAKTLESEVYALELNKSVIDPNEYRHKMYSTYFRYL